MTHLTQDKIKRTEIETELTEDDLQAPGGNLQRTEAGSVRAEDLF